MLNNYFNRPRKKAWVGTAIGLGVNLLGSFFGANAQKKAQERQYALQRAAEARNTGLTSAANLTQAYANADELDREFKSRFMRMGGRKKCAWGAEDTTALINSFGNAGSSIVTSIIGQAQQKAAYPGAIKPITNDRKDDVAYDSAARSEFLNNYYRTSMMRCGGRRR